jgi:dihydroorotase
MAWLWGAGARGVAFDVGHGGGSFDYPTAEIARAQGFSPDVLSTDIHCVAGNKPGMPYLTWVMSKFMNLGYSLDEVVEMSTVKAARVIDRIPMLGTLQVGAPGDVAIMDLVESKVLFHDTRGNTREGSVHLEPVQTIVGGIPFGRPYAQPFSVT